MKPSVVFAALSLLVVGCVGPGDRALAEERIAMEEAQAEIIRSSPDCAQMSYQLAQWYVTNRGAVDANDAWWNALSETQSRLSTIGLADRDSAAFGQRMSAIIRCGDVAWFSDRTALGDPPLTGVAPARAVAALAPDALSIPVDAPRRGASSPRLVVHVFSEFESPFCARLAPTLDRLMEEYGDRVMLVFRHAPQPYHAHSEPAARAAMEVRAQLGDDAFWAYHDVLFAHQRALTDEDLASYASRVPGIDLPRFQTALATQAHAHDVLSDQLVAAELGYSGTPTLRIGATALRGAQTYETLRAAVDAELAR